MFYHLYFKYLIKIFLQARGCHGSKFYRKFCSCKLEEYKFYFKVPTNGKDLTPQNGIIVQSIERVEEKGPIVIEDDEIIQNYKKRKQSSEKRDAKTKRIIKKNVKLENN